MKEFNFHILGGIQIQSRNHIVEYEPGQMVGSNTLYVRLNKENAPNVPVYYSQIGALIELLQRGKRAIEAVEGE